MTEVVHLTVPAERMTTQLRHYISEGRTPEQAVEAVIEPYQLAPVAEHIRGVLLNMARQAEYETDRRHERQIFRRHNALTKQERKLISVVTFRTGDGRKVEWGQASANDHMARIMWNTNRQDQLGRDSDRHAAAIKMIEEEKVAKLDDIADWQERISEACQSWEDYDKDDASLVAS